MIEKIKCFVDMLCESNGSKYKAHILRHHRDDIDIVTFLEYYFNPFKITNISSKKISKPCGTFIETRELTSWNDFINFLVNECSGKNSDIKAIQNFVKKDKDYRQFLEGVATKSIKMGISAKTLNEVYGDDFVPEVKLQLACKYHDHKSKVEGNKFSITLKLDGIRCIVTKRGNNVSMITRQGRPIFEANEIVNELKTIKGDFILDGELLPAGWKKMESKEAYKLATSLVKTDGPKKGLVFVAFDIMQEDMPHHERIRYLKELLRGLKFSQNVPWLYEGYDMSKVDEYLSKVRDKGQEGLMINMSDDTYRFERTTSLLKVKVMQDCDLEVVGVQEGNGKYVGTLGALVVKYKGNTINVGSGITDAVRNKIWKYQKAIIGRVIKVQYFEETRDSSGKKSLRFPVFLEICPKGKEPSIH